MEGGGPLSIKRDPKRKEHKFTCMQNETVARNNTFTTTRCIEMQISLVRARPKATTHVPSLLRQTTLPPHSQPLRCTHAARSATAQQSVPRAAGDLHRESSSASHQSRATNTFHSISTPQVSLGCPFGNPTEQAAPRPSQWEAPPDSSACKGGTPSVAISMPSLKNGKPSSIAVTI
jgi:hypothetical protein